MMLFLLELTLLLIIAFVIGSFLLRPWKEQNRKKLLQKQILQAAARHNGTVSLTLLLAETDGDLPELQKILEQWVQLGICELDLSPEGKPIYVFSDIAALVKQKSNGGSSL